ncbi:hypothetical protein ACVIGB_000914 [Bradyrhizobium sp. USDA 4341]
MEHCKITLGYNHLVNVRIKRKRDAEWRVSTSTVELPIRVLKGSDAPVAGRLVAGPFSEEYRAVDGKLYRAAGTMWNGGFEPLTLAKLTPEPGSQVKPLSDLPRLTMLPWKHHEVQRGFPLLKVHHLYEDPVAETFEDHAPKELARIFLRAHELVAIGEHIFCPSSAPMIEVDDVPVSLRLASGLDLDNSDPEINQYGGHRSTYFSFDRRDDAGRFARHYAAQFEHPPGSLEPPDASLQVEGGFEHLFAVDDFVESARRNLSFAAYDLGRSAMSRDTAGLAAFCELRDSVYALERPEGRTRSNALRAYEAAARLVAAPEGPFSPAGEARAGTDWIKRVLSISMARAAWDKSFVPSPEESVDPDQQAALAAVAGL